MTNPVLAPVMQQTCLQVFFRLVDVEVLKLGSDKKGESVGRLIRAGGESHEDHHQVMLDEIINYVQSLQQQVEVTGSLELCASVCIFKRWETNELWREGINDVEIDFLVKDQDPTSTSDEDLEAKYHDEQTVLARAKSVKLNCLKTNDKMSVTSSDQFEEHHL
ncbi:hypothetical protein ISN44_As06g009510 [Arabidopsis suecica]|uniref:Uncharacterized protein n=2 Tax=Arabidopsis TaxID=3701 RepID=F4I2Q7_ARATH|nr:uncharacterized protein AT1G10100 [Arabidopsis thaliana]AEE28542.1 hypothetical protein AT1G10100 [Arabidopsis thaliana]KAG7596501.1 hypothetical protein ISN44_As06g009510 [Arabidopsis suecica]|eukprot:NP_172481.2 hypothetical protein AT1G10100 [Arabidopsis thaliana]